MPSNARSSADAKGSRDAPQIRDIALEKACNKEMTFKDTQGHYTVAAIRQALYEYHFLLVACCYISI